MSFKFFELVSMTAKRRSEKEYAYLTFEYTVRGVIFFEGSPSAGRGPKMSGFRFMICLSAPCPDPWVV